MDKQIADYVSKLQKLLRGNTTNENAGNICKEIESHLAEKAADLEATGISRDAAVSMAIEEFGKPEKVASTFIGAGRGLRLFDWPEWTAVLSLVALELIIVYTTTTEAAEGQLRPLLTMLALLAVTFVVSLAFCRRILIAPFACAAALGGAALTCSVSYAHVGPMCDSMGLMREHDLRELAAHRVAAVAAERLVGERLDRPYGIRRRARRFEIATRVAHSGTQQTFVPIPEGSLLHRSNHDLD